jgi:hypothetical protein
MSNTTERAVNFFISKVSQQFTDGLKLLGPVVAACHIERENKGVGCGCPVCIPDFNSILSSSLIF